MLCATIKIILFTKKKKITVTLFTLTWKPLLKALENCTVCVQTPHAEEQRLLTFHIAFRFILILKELSMKHFPACSVALIKLKI